MNRQFSYMRTGSHCYIKIEAERQTVIKKAMLTVEVSGVGAATYSIVVKIHLFFISIMRQVTMRTALDSISICEFSWGLQI